MKNIPKTIIFPQFPSITAYQDDDDDEEEVDLCIGDIAEQYLRKFSSKSGTDCGIRILRLTLGTKKQK